MKKLFGIFTMLLTLVFAFSCGKKAEENVAKSTGKKVAIVYSTGGKGDKSFNDSAYRGLSKAQKELGVEVAEYEPKDPSVEATNALDNYAQSGEYDLIIGVGFNLKEGLEKVSAQYPDQKFALIDDVIDNKDNVISLMFREQEGAFLTGALAAMVTKTNTIGAVGAVAVPVINRFITGYIQGARYINPDINIITVYINGSNPFGDPVSAKTLTENLISKNADVIIQVAGASGAGVFKAAQEKNVFAIGVDSNQDGEAKGNILTSMVKNVDVAVYETIKSVLDGKFESGVKYFGIAEDGVDTTDFEFTKDKIGQENIDKIKALKEDIKSGKIKVDENGPLN